MLTFGMISDSGGAAKYFESTDDYYTQKGHKGEWSGKAAKKLGLEGEVKSSVFKDLLDGYLPSTGEKLRGSKRADTKDRKGIDFTFNAPKSISIQALLNGDERVLVAHDMAVKTALLELEKLSISRKKKNYITSFEKTENLAIASFRHELSREQDPHVHTHNVVMNLTMRSDGEWRALSNEKMLENTKLLGALYKNELAQNIQKLGYSLRETKTGWELEHVSDEAIKLFSKRSNQIEKTLNELGEDRSSVTGKEKQLITIKTRKKKKETNRLTLHKNWAEEANQAGVSYKLETPINGFVFSQYGREEKTLASSYGNSVSWEKGFTERQESAYSSVMFAVDHIGERQGIIEKKELLATAYEHGVVSNTTSEIDNALSQALKNGVIHAEPKLYQTAQSLGKYEKDGSFKEGSLNERVTFTSWVALVKTEGYDDDSAKKIVKERISSGILVPSEERYATKKARETEISLLAIERVGRGSVIPLFTENEINKVIEGSNLNSGQRDSVNLILRTKNRFVGIQGIAGTGKSHMLSHLVDGIGNNSNIEQNKNKEYKVVGLAPYSSQTKALKELGMKADTLASFLINSKKQESLDSQTIVILDEASVVPAKDMKKLMKIIERKDARLVLNGDIKQTQAIESGKPFEQLQNLGMATAYLKDIQRQKDGYLKEAVKLASKDEVAKSVDLLNKDIVQVKNNEERYNKIAVEFAAYTPKERESVLIVAGTNEARAAINVAVREKIGFTGGVDVQTLIKVDMTRAQAKGVRFYSKGMVVVSAARDSELEQNKQYKISSIDRKTNTVDVVDNENKVTTFNVKEMQALKVFNTEIIKLEKNERVQIIDNKKDLNLINGERYRVVANNEESLSLEVNGETIALSKKDALPLRYGYATTVHSSQGLTSDRVIIDADVNSKTSNRSVYYVAISRPRDGVKIFTNNKGSLAKSMGREQKKSSALDMYDSYNEDFNKINILKKQVNGSSSAVLRDNITPKQKTKNKTLSR